MGEVPGRARSIGELFGRAAGACSVVDAGRGSSVAGTALSRNAGGLAARLFTRKGGHDARRTPQAPAGPPEGALCGNV